MTWAEFTMLFAGVGATLCFTVWFIDDRRKRRATRTLTYDVPRPGGALQKLGEAFANSISQTTYGTCSTAEWQRRCEASLRASRRRRGLDA